MFGFKDICAERHRQLTRQAQVDEKLKVLPCVNLVNTYLFLQREKNRRLTQEYVDASFYQIPGIATKQLQETGKDLDVIEKILTTQCACWELSNHLPGKKGETEIV